MMADSIRIEIHNMKEVQAKMEQIARDITGSPMHEAMADATMVVQRDAKKNVNVNTGRLRASITPEVRTHTNRVVGVVGTNVVYAAAHEFGSKPHTPPFEPIQRYVHLKSKGKADPGAAGALWAHIRRYGTKAHPFLYPALRDNSDRIKRIFQAAFRKIVRK